MQTIAETFRQIVIVVLVVGGASLVGLLGFLVTLRGLRELRFRRREQLKNQYRPLIDRLLRLDPPRETIIALVEAPRRHRAVMGELLLAPLRVAHGAFVDNLRMAAAALELIDGWLGNLSNRRWWIRAEAARALGLIQEPDGTIPLIRALDDEHDEVRAAAVEALGCIADPRAIPALLDRLSQTTKYPPARVILALRAFGEAATPALINHARRHPADLAALAGLLEMVGGAAATDDLMVWCQDPRPEVRAASLRALGTIGIDDRAYACVTAALSDPDPNVRAMAARALGRSRREEASPLLGSLLEDDWIVAAHAATALRALGASGAAVLQARSSDEGQPGDLARQMLWETLVDDAPSAASPSALSCRGGSRTAPTRTAHAGAA